MRGCALPPRYMPQKSESRPLPLLATQCSAAQHGTEDALPA